MAYVEQIRKSKAIAARKQTVRAARGEVLHAKPKKLNREQFEQAYKRVTSRIPKTLAILAK